MKQKNKWNEVSIRKIMVIVSRALKVSYRTKSRMSLLVSVLGFIMAFLPLWISGTLRKFTDEIQFISEGQNGIVDALLIFTILIGLYLLQAGYTAAQEYFLEVDKQRTTKYIKSTIISCTSQVEYKYIENEGDFRDKLAFAEMFGGSQVATSMQQVTIILQNLLAITCISFALINVNVWIVIALVVTCIPSVLLSIKQKDEDYKNKTKSMREGAMSVHLFYMASGANENCKSLNDVRFYGIYPWIKEKWLKVSQGYIKQKNEITRKYLLYNSFADILRNCVYIGILLIVAKEIYDNPLLGLGLFMLVYTLSSQFQISLTKVFVGSAQFLGDIKFMRDFFELQDTPKEELEENPKIIENADIVFDNVSFTYPNSTDQVLKKINVSIKQGEKIAIVGANGSGKSTFINLLCGMHNPTTGEVIIGGLNVKDYLLSIRNAISVVFQNFGRYEASIRDNITIADKERNASDEELLEIVKKANALTLLESQSNGLDEILGTFSETGNNLSGGQWQKLALTRAIYRNNARIMILDEPTAALDPVAEAELYSDFTDLTSDKTTILISHRMGITAVVDRILVFAHGEIVEDGTHEQLLSKGGEYAKMYESQAQWYGNKIAFREVSSVNEVTV